MHPKYRILLNTLLSLVLCTGMFQLPVCGEDSAVDENHPFRLKRQDDVEQNQRIENHPGTPLQGQVTRVGIFDQTEAGSSGLIPDLKDEFPAPDFHKPPITGHVGLIDTPPVMLPGKGVFAPPAVYRGWLEKTHPEFSLQTDSMNPNRLVVVYDKYDDTGRTLGSLGLQFNTISKRDLDGFDLRDTQVLVIDCGPNNLSPQALIKVRDFVARGGFLFTTDWMLDRIDQLMFPGFIAWNGAMNSQKMYDAEVVGQNPVLYRNAVSHAYWKMDIHCHLIRVLNKDAVKVLAVSRTLVMDDPDRQGILAVVFPFERGYVMHMTAHFDRSQQIIGYYLADPAPAIGISLRQALAINFVVAGLTGKKP